MGAPTTIALTMRFAFEVYISGAPRVKLPPALCRVWVDRGKLPT